MMPNFLVIGCPKAGTTSLYHYLSEHPEIYMSAIKEPHFFALEGKSKYFKGPRDDLGYLTVNGVEDISVYQSLFDGVEKETVMGEASTMYLYFTGTANRIKYHLPHIKLIAILRHPVERAYSHYLHLVRDGREHLPFSQAILQEENRINHNWSPVFFYRKVGLYAEQLKPYFELFSPSQIKIFLYDDWKLDNHTVLSEICSYLGVSDYSINNQEIYNRFNYVPKNKLINKFLVQENKLKSAIKKIIPERLGKMAGDKLYNYNSIAPLPMKETVRSELLTYFREDTVELQDIIGMDLSNWLI